jgi:hypothetical protein
MKTSTSFALFVAAACLAMSPVAHAIVVVPPQGETFEFIPNPNSLGPNGTDFSTPSYIRFVPDTGSFSFGGGGTAVVPNLFSGPTFGTDYVASWDINVPLEADLTVDGGTFNPGGDIAFNPGDSHFGPGTQFASWGPGGINEMNLTLDSDSGSLSANLVPGAITLSDPTTLHGTWQAIPDATSTFSLLAAAGLGLFAVSKLQRRPALA